MLFHTCSIASFDHSYGQKPPTEVDSFLAHTVRNGVGLCLFGVLNFVTLYLLTGFIQILEKIGKYLGNFQGLEKSGK